MIKVSLLTAYYFSSHPFAPKIETKGGYWKRNVWALPNMLQPIMIHQKFIS